MELSTLAVHLQKVDDRSLRNEGRIKKLEDEHEVLHNLATSVAVMAEKMDAMNASVKSLASKVDELENKPAKRWDGLVDKLLFAVVGAFLAWLVAGATGL